MLVQDFLHRSAKQFPDKTALIFQNRRLSYRTIDQLANQMAHALIDMGIQRGDRIVVYLPNSIGAVVSIWGILKAGAVFLVVNRSTKPDKLAFILNDCTARACITDDNAAHSLSEMRESIPSLSVIISSQQTKLRGRSIFVTDFSTIYKTYSITQPNNSCIDMDLAALIYTSGSTGRPKGVMLTHLNIISAATSITQYLENESSDIIINVLPLSFDYGLYQVLMTFQIGGTLVLEQSFTFPMLILKKIIEERVTGFPIVPTMAAMLLQIKTLGDFDFRHVRYISNTAAHLPSEHIRQLRQYFPETSIYCMYGLTECKRVSYLPPGMLEVKPGSVGKGMPNEEVFLVDENGKRLGLGSTGELVVRGSNVMKGYWNLPEETDRVLRPGPYPWEKVLYTGDIFRTDEDGYLYFVSRKDDIIKSRGEKVSPKEIENVIYQLQGVTEAAVIGVPDPVLGEAIKLFVVAGNSVHLSEQDIRQFCASHLEDYMQPKYIEFRESLPKTSSGKIRKKGLC